MNNTKKAVITIFLISTFLINQIASADNYGYDNTTESNKALLYTGLAVGVAGAVTAAVLAYLQNDNEKPINPSKIEVNNIHFTNPGENNRQTLTIKNASTETTSINSITFTGGAKNYVTIYQNNCPKDLIANENCNIILEASAEAYDGTAIIDHGYNNITAISNITTAKSPIELYETTSGEPVLIPASQNINLEKKLDEESKKQTFKWVNKGKFYWHQPYLEKKSWFSNNDVTLDEDTCGTKSNPGEPVAPEGECTFSTTVNITKLEATATLSTKCALDTLDLPVYNKTLITGNGLEITLNQNASDYHLGYRSLNLTSTASEKTITLENIDPISSTDKIEYCSISSGCSEQFKPDSSTYNNCKIGKTLVPGESCKLWMHANRRSETYPYTENNQIVAVSAEWSWPGSSNVNESKTFKARTDLALYAGGAFTQPDNYVAKWDGTNWYTLASGTNGIVRTIFVHPNTGDLYIGGEFTSPYAYLMRWNGYNWNKMTNGPNAKVMAIDHHSTSNKLYIGGDFTNPGSKVARCDENDNCEQAIPTNAKIESGIVHSLMGDSQFIYVAGDFTVAGNIGHRYTAAWSINTNYWDPMTSGTAPNSTMYKLGEAGSFGILTGVGERFAASWVSGPGWVFFWNPPRPPYYNPFPFDAAVRTMTNLTKDNDTYLYVGGDFTSNNYNHIAKYLYGSSNSWISLDNGVNGTVYDMVALDNQHIYVGGSFSSASNHTANRIALWAETNSTWSGIGGSEINNDVIALAYTTSLSLDDNY